MAAKALPFLAKTILPTLATGALSGVGSGLAQKATNKAMGSGLYLKKRLKHCKSRNRRPRVVFETFQRFRAWHGWRWLVFETGRSSF